MPAARRAVVVPARGGSGEGHEIQLGRSPGGSGEQLLRDQMLSVGKRRYDRCPDGTNPRVGEQREQEEAGEEGRARGAVGGATRTVCGRHFRVRVGLSGPT